MEELSLETLRHICMNLDISSLLRVNLLSKKWLNEVCNDEWWKIRYNNDQLKYSYAIQYHIQDYNDHKFLASIPNNQSVDISLFCRIHLKKVGDIESIWDPTNKSGVKGPRGPKGTCDKKNWR
jgi:hypothetical protein